MNRVEIVINKTVKKIEIVVAGLRWKNNTAGGGEVTSDNVAAAIDGFTPSPPTAHENIVMSGKKLLPMTSLLTFLQTLFSGFFAPKTHGHTDLQPRSDEALQTTDKSIVGGINEIRRAALGAQQAESELTYATLIAAVNLAEANDPRLFVGKSLYIVTLGVVDLWVSGRSNTHVPYLYTTDEKVMQDLSATGVLQVGYYLLSFLETPKVDMTNYLELDGDGSQLQNISALQILESPNRLFLSTAQKAAYDSADLLSHQHPYQSVIDAITQMDVNNWNGKLAATKAAIEGLLTGAITTHTHTAANTTSTNGNVQSDLNNLFLLDNRDFQNRKGTIEIVDNLRTTTAISPSSRSLLSSGTAVARADGLYIVSCSTTANSGARFDIVQNIYQMPYTFLNQYNLVTSFTDLTNIYRRIGLCPTTITDETRPMANFKVTAGGVLVTQTFGGASGSVNANNLTGLATLTAGTVYHFRVTFLVGSVVFEVFSSSGILLSSYTANTQIPTNIGSVNLLGDIGIDLAGVTAREIYRDYHRSTKLNSYGYGALS